MLDLAARGAQTMNLFLRNISGGVSDADRDRANQHLHAPTSAHRRESRPRRT